MQILKSFGGLQRTDTRIVLLTLHAFIWELLLLEVHGHYYHRGCKTRNSFKMTVMKVGRQ